MRYPDGDWEGLNQAGEGVDDSFSLNRVSEMDLVGSRMEPGRE